MAFFTAIGTISNDIARRETKNGVVATFRLETGAPRGRKLWIDIECWGHLAGTLNRHGYRGRTVGVTGQLTSRTWRDRESGSRRQRFVVRALDASLLGRFPLDTLPPNVVVASGTLLRRPTAAPAGAGVAVAGAIRTGRRGVGDGQFDLAFSFWVPRSQSASHHVGYENSRVAAAGSLAWNSETRRLRLECTHGSLAASGAQPR